MNTAKTNCLLLFDYTLRLLMVSLVFLCCVCSLHAGVIDVRQLALTFRIFGIQLFGLTANFVPNIDSDEHPVSHHGDGELTACVHNRSK